jgi:hypothetical protein
MKIKITKTETTDLHITPPIYWKQPGKKSYLGYLSDEQIIEFTSNGERYKSVGHFGSFLGQSRVESAFNEWEEIGEDVFLQEHEIMLREMSLVPTLTEREPKFVGFNPEKVAQLLNAEVNA